MYELPTELDVAGEYYNIRKRGDYRMVLDVFSVLEDNSITQSERILSALVIFYEDFDTIEDVLSHKNLEDFINAMFKFFNADRQDATKNARKLIDWENDSALIASAINNVAHTEIRAEEYVHWWTFMGYYMAIGESTLSTIIGIRDKILKGKKLEKWERDFRNENPQYFTWKHDTIEEQDANKWIMDMWNSGV